MAVRPGGPDLLHPRLSRFKASGRSGPLLHRSWLRRSAQAQKMSYPGSRSREACEATVKVPGLRVEQASVSNRIVGARGDWPRGGPFN